MDKQEPVTAFSAVAGFSKRRGLSALATRRSAVVSYVRKRLAEIKADPALRRANQISVRSAAAYIARWLTVVGNGKRFLIIVHLIDGEKTVGELATLIGLSPTASSQHLGLLTEEGIVESRADGTRRYYCCKSEAAKAVIMLLDGLTRDNKIPIPQARKLTRRADESSFQ